MKTSKNIARLAVTAGLTAALSFGGVMAPVTMAFAAEGGNSIIISQVEGNESTKFKAYQIFKATVTDAENGGKTAQNITWASDTVGEKVIDAITKDWKGYDSLEAKDQLSDSPTAQEVADFLMAHAGSTTAGSTSTDGTRIATNNVLYAVANAVKSENPASTNIATGVSWTPDPANGNGYYLFVTNGDSLGATKKNTGTSPIFAVVGGSVVTVYEKTSVPTVEKKILDDSKVTGGAITGVAEANWKDAADSQIGQKVNYKLTGTIADNYASYDSYSYKFKDTLEKGLDFVDDSLSVYALNGDAYTEIAPASYAVTKPTDSSRDLVVDFSKGEKGLKSATAKNVGPLTIDANTKIVVFYEAKLNAKAVIAGDNNKLEGNPNTVTLEYSNNPMVAGTGTSAPDTVKDYTYGLKINKVDLGTEKALKDAKFTITTNGDEKSTEVKYVTKDGALSDDMVELSTGADGVIKLTGLDAGVYTVTETSAPDGYTKVEPFTFEIKPTMSANDPDTGLTALSGTLDSKNQSDKVIAGLTDKNAGDNKLTAQDGSEKVTDGYFNITVGDTKQVGLPLTGLNGVTFTWIAGGAVLCIGVAHLIRSRKQAEESEQE
ncbi:isopeptide-forming domain-containing fimbrial protein [Collinsella sp. AF19-7AC]|uniref:isopeptide-forming domain-containing fimbrial protein n=1 Tax=unclassified Collinsella TaxID=2637548 RepID=UPI000E5580DF|nr:MULTISPECIES: isopeptide-forming domain-containing fimbrial protein [unclassified Collinsella]RGT06390.1 isopeptide-forming domain-containing fimbrial protein [Collinsella sp. AF19-7AC]RGT33524.1 isopeptide-forming domain-containing fimbrial protein [Collinsella sp. AF19-1LB]RHE30227.1 isopeptide-forming domain-containing fimbrial protein [Collinsella sp. AM29-10AC]